MGESSPVNRRFSFTNSTAMPRVVRSPTIFRKSINDRAKRSILCITTVSPSRQYANAA
jgi:hypothetical protein